MNANQLINRAMNTLNSIRGANISRDEVNTGVDRTYNDLYEAGRLLGAFDVDNVKGVSGYSCLRPPVHAHMWEITPQLRQEIADEVRNMSQNMLPFDVATDIAHAGTSLQLTGEEDNWAIPVYVLEIAESIMGPG